MLTQRWSLATKSWDAVGPRHECHCAPASEAEISQTSPPFHQTLNDVFAHIRLENYIEMLGLLAFRREFFCFEPLVEECGYIRILLFFFRNFFIEIAIIKNHIDLICLPQKSPKLQRKSLL